MVLSSNRFFSKRNPCYPLSITFEGIVHNSRIHCWNTKRRGDRNNSQGNVECDICRRVLASERETKRSEASRGESRRVEATVRRVSVRKRA